MRFTDERRYFVSEATIYRLLKAQDLITSPAYVVVKAADEFRDKTTALNQLWQTDFTDLLKSSDDGHVRERGKAATSQPIMREGSRNRLQAALYAETLYVRRTRRFCGNLFVVGQEPVKKLRKYISKHRSSAPVLIWLAIFAISIQSSKIHAKSDQDWIYDAKKFGEKRCNSGVRVHTERHVLPKRTDNPNFSWIKTAERNKTDNPIIYLLDQSNRTRKVPVEYLELQDDQVLDYYGERLIFSKIDQLVFLWAQRNDQETISYAIKYDCFIFAGPQIVKQIMSK